MRWPFVWRYTFQNVERRRLEAVVKAMKMEDEATEYAKLSLTLEGDVAAARAATADWKAKFDHEAEVSAGLLRNVQAIGEELRQARMPAVVPEPLTEDERQRLLASKCVNCGGVHSIACPRIKRMRFRADGQTPVEVEFWADGEWPKDRVVWLEDLT